MIRAVIDTNVAVSALIAPNGKEALIILAVRQGLVRPCYSAATLAEHTEVLSRPKFGFPQDEVAALLSTLREYGELAASEELSATGAVALPDPDDAVFLRCAMALAADCIVTGNKRHFPREACGAVEILNAGELLDRIALEL